VSRDKTIKGQAKEECHQKQARESRASGSSKMAMSHMVVTSTAAQLQAASRVTDTDGVNGGLAWQPNGCWSGGEWKVTLVHLVVARKSNQPSLLCQSQASHGWKERLAKS